MIWCYWDSTDPLHPVKIANILFEPIGSTYNIIFHQNITSKSQYIFGQPKSLPEPINITAAPTVDLRATNNGADYIIITHSNFANAIQQLADFYTLKGMRVSVINVDDIYDEFNGGEVGPGCHP